MKWFICMCLLCLLIAPTQGQGGFLPTEGYTVATDSSEIIYQISGDTVQMHIRNTFTRDAEPFVWILPVDGIIQDIRITQDRYEIMDERRFLPSGAITYIGQETSPCDNIFGIENDAYDFPFTLFFGDNNPVENSDILTADELLAWLADSTYTFTDEQTQIISQYAQTVENFIILQILPEFEDTVSGWTSLISITYTKSSEQLLVPLRLAALPPAHPERLDVPASFLLDEMPITIRVIADTAYVPQNYPLVYPRPEYMQPAHSLLFSRMAFSRRRDGILPTEVHRLLNIADETTFVMLFAGEVVREDVTLYVTEFYGRVQRVATLDDLILIAAPETPDFVAVDKSTVDPLHFWGCSTRELQADRIYYEWLDVASSVNDLTDSPVDYDTIADVLPAGSTYIAEFQQPVRYPNDWVMSRYDYEETVQMGDHEIDISFPVYAFAPQLITVDTVTAFDAGEPTPPMFLVAATSSITRYGQTFARSAFGINNAQGFVFERPRFNEYDNPRAVAFYLLVSDEEYAAHQAMYDAMLALPYTYQYYAHPELRHTLFWSWGQIGFPDGWVEYLAEDRYGFNFLPTFEDNNNRIEFRIERENQLYIPWGYALEEQQAFDEETWLDEQMTRYHFLPEVRPILADFLAMNVCNPITPPLAFNDGERRGYYRLDYDGWFFSVSTPIDSTVDDSILSAMSASLSHETFAGCG